MSRGLRSCEGQAVIEACVSALALAFFVKLSIVALYTAFAHLWLDYQSHELAVCITQPHKSKMACEYAFRSRIQNTLRMGQITKVFTQKRRDHVLVKTEFHVINNLEIARKKRINTSLLR